jgi:hypothetical protein
VRTDAGWVLEYPEYPLVILQAFTSETVPPKARAAIQTYGQQTFQALVALIGQGQAEGTVISGDPVELTVAFTACIQGLALSRMQASGEAPTPADDTNAAPNPERLNTSRQPMKPERGGQSIKTAHYD